MRYGSVCSGIEAATVAWHGLGWEPQWFSEIEAFPSAVLAHHYPHVPNLGDMTKIHESEVFRDSAIDLLVGGTPCQSFSVAGLRKGLDDPRGNLALVFLALAERARPRWVVWENVPGVLSSNGGRDFGAFLGGLAELGYGWAYRVLDAQYFGVAQRRRRVFVVGHLGDWRRAAAVLFERDSLSGNPAPCREERAGITRGLEIGPQGGRFVDLAPTLDTRCKDGPIRNQLGAAVIQDVAHTLRGEGFDASEDGTGRGIPLVAHGVSLRGRDGGGTAELMHGLSPAIRASSGGGDKPHVLITPDVASCNTTRHGKGPDSDVTTTLIAFAQNQRDELRTMEVAGALAAEPGMKQQTYIAFNARQDPTHSADVFDPLGTKDTGHGQAMPRGVRRLTPRECERLQGFPDDYSLIPYRGKAAADGPRYKALGNSMAVPCMTWLGKRIQAVEDLINGSITRGDAEGKA